MKKYGLFALISIATLVWACEKNSPREPVFTGTGGTPATGMGAAPGTGGFTFDGGGLGDGGFDPDAPVTPVQFSKAALIKATGDCALGLYKQFALDAGRLQAAVAAYAATLSPEDLAAAQTAWRLAMATWQQAEAFLFGPAAGSAELGGQGLRDQIYAFPSVSRCQVDIQLVNQLYAKPEFGNSFINARGLGALEYLLFYAGTTNACAVSSEINVKGTWAAVPAAELPRRRADYAAAVAAALVPRSQALVNAWEGGGFKNQLEAAGKSSQLFTTDQAALNAIFAGVLPVDHAIRHEKTLDPLGGTENCAQTPCPGALESPYARESTANIVNNLVGLKRVLLGCDANGEGIGFDDWLISVGQADLAQQLRGLFGNAVGAATTLAPPLEDAITTAPGNVVAVRTAVGALTTFLKTQFRSLLNLDLPMSVEGDND
ncbi:MAG: imelysin family protein [Deltaproteobacteria bacterium]|nr:imelysin family protein [Deltaproteobacteria bacterium]